jgi:hypothetical protein
MKPEDLKAAEAVAKALLGERTPEKEAEIRDRIAREFFADTGIPPGMYRGWAILEDLRKKRAEIGYPVPPGGVMLLGYQSVMGSCLAEMHTALAIALGVPPGAITLSVQWDARRRPIPVASFDPPQDWIAPTGDIGAYVGDALNRLRATYWFTLEMRLAAVDKIRPELQQPLEPWVAENREN